MLLTPLIIKPKQLLIIVAGNEDSFNSVSAVGQEMENQKLSFTHMIELDCVTADISKTWWTLDD